MHDRPDDDDLNRLLAAAPAPPADLAARLLRRGEIARRSGRTTLLLGAVLALVVSLAVLSVLLGRAVADAGTSELLLVALQDRTLLLDDPSGYGQALLQDFPWTELLAVTVNVLVLVALLGRLLRAIALERPAARAGRLSAS